MLSFAISEDDPDRTSPSEASAKKRARLVCVRCHGKKIKCDLLAQSKDGEAASRCSNCADAGCPCQLRPSKRGKRRRTALARAGLQENLDNAWPATEPHSETQYVDAEAEVDPQPTTPAIFDEQRADDSPPQHGQNEFAVVESSAQLPQLPLPPPLPMLPPASGPLAPLAIHAVARSRLDKEQRQPSYIGDSGYMQIFGNESGDIEGPLLPPTLTLDHTPVGLQDGHFDVYFEFAWTWCPVLDRETLDADPSLRQSLLLRHSLALCANQISPSLLHRSSSAEHYARAKALFYGNHEPNPLVRIMAVMLFYWWSVEPPSVVSLNNTSWWTGTAIRVAQQIGLHCESETHGATLVGEWPGLRRRIWWTLVARERITSISQGRPCIVDLRDCDVPMPTANDFPNPGDIRTLLFVQWVPLCELIGRIGNMLRRKPRDPDLTVLQLAQELIAWVQNLPPLLKPAFQSSRTKGFHRDVHGMHLTYLSAITLLHLSKDALPLPKASVAAIVAASCTSRIFHDYLVRGSVSFLAGQAGWYISIAILALLHARRLEGLRAHADAEIGVLRAALGVMAKTWHSAQSFEQGFAKLLDAGAHTAEPPLHTAEQASPSLSPSIDEVSAMVGINWQDYFPYVTGETSPLINVLFAREAQTSPFADFSWSFDFATHLNQFLEGSDSINLDYLSL